MQEPFLISLYVNIVLMVTVLYFTFQKRITQYFKNLKKKKRVARSSRKNLEKANSIRIIRAEVRKYLSELQNDE